MPDFPKIVCSLRECSASIVEKKNLTFEAGWLAMISVELSIEISVELHLVLTVCSHLSVAKRSLVNIL